MIEIRINASCASEAQSELRALLAGFHNTDAIGEPGGSDPVARKELAQGIGAGSSSEPAREDQTEGAGETNADASDEPRVYGTASEGRARRTKEEMAEDKEIEELAEKLGVKKIPTDVAATEVLDALRQKDDETEEEPAAPAATRDDLLAAMKRYVDAIGPDEAMGNLPDILGVKKQSDLPDDPAVFAEKIAALDAATEEAA